MRELPKHYYQIGDALPASAGCIMPHSEVCMSMRVAGKAMGWKIIDERMVQLYDAKGEEFSAPVLLGEAGFYQDEKGIYRNDCEQDATHGPDVIVRNCGSIFQFIPITPAARTWIDENVQNEGWQWLGSALCVEHHYVLSLIDGLCDAGFEVSAA